MEDGRRGSTSRLPSFVADVWARRGRAARAAVRLASLTVRDARRDRIGGVAAQVAFFALLAIPPVLLVLAGLIGYVEGLLSPEAADALRVWLVRALGGFLAPDTTEGFVRPTVDDLFTRGRGGVASVGGLVAVWSASRLVRALIEAMNVAYDVEEWRPAWKRRLLAVGLTAGGLFLLAVFLPLLVAGPSLGRAIDDRFGLGGILGDVWSLAYWPVAVGFALGLLATFYHVAPSRWTPWLRDLPGALLATAGWLAAAVAMRVYVGFAVDEGRFGSLAAPVVLLLWFYASALVVLAGAELNAEIEKLWPAGRGPRPGGSVSGHPARRAPRRSD